MTGNDVWLRDDLCGLGFPQWVFALSHNGSAMEVLSESNRRRWKGLLFLPSVKQMLLCIL